VFRRLLPTSWEYAAIRDILLYYYRCYYYRRSNRSILERIGSLLTRLIQRSETGSEQSTSTITAMLSTGTGTGAGTGTSRLFRDFFFRTGACQAEMTG
jgi:hypothetical protein